MLPPHSDHQSECLLHSLFLGCVSRGLLSFSHEDIIDFDICAHGAYPVCRVYRRMILYTFEPRPTIRGSINKNKIPHGNARRIEKAGVPGRPSYRDNHRSSRSRSRSCARSRNAMTRPKLDCPLHQHVKFSLLHRYIESDIMRHGRSLRMLVFRRSSSIRVAPSHPSSVHAITAMFRCFNLGRRRSHLNSSPVRNELGVP
jgi:hypothetical protein